MGQNRIQSLDPTALAALASQMISTLGTGPSNPYGVPSASVEKLNGERSGVLAAATEVEAARASYRAAVQDRDAALVSCAAQVAEIARAVYVNSAVTPGMIAQLGLSPRSTTRAKVVPQKPVDLVANFTTSGRARLDWGRGGNASGVGYLVEARTGTSDWRLVADTTRTTATLDGFTSGEPVEFRVCASKNGAITEPSNSATLFTATAASPGLRLAA